MPRTQANGEILFSDPVQMLEFVDDDVFSGKLRLYKWQKAILMDFAKPSTAQDPFKAAVRAANGSGKDKMLIAPACVWLACRYARTLCIVTNASGNQLDRQTDRYIRYLLLQINAVFGSEVWKINYRHYTNTHTGSTIELFATDEPGKAEGWHPDSNMQQMGIFVSEAKSVPEEIFQALVRCTGFTKRLDVSSPGAPNGHFYTLFGLPTWKHYHVTAFDCPHLSEQYANEIGDLYKRDSHLYKSMVLAEFGGDEGEPTVLTWVQLQQCMSADVVHVVEKFNTGGLDLSAGGDETVLAVRNGNALVGLEAFRMKDTAAMVPQLEMLFRKWGLLTLESRIYTDAGGLGKPIVDQLRARGWKNVVSVLNQQKPMDSVAYVNVGAENWFRFARLVQDTAVVFKVVDQKLKQQLVGRYYKRGDKDRYQLESKMQAKAKGHVSPDRADAVVLAFRHYKAPREGVLPVVAMKPLVERPRLNPNPLTIKRCVEEQIKSPLMKYRMNGGQRDKHLSEDVKREFARQRRELSEALGKEITI